MGQLLILTFICAVSTAPEHCDRKTAFDVFSQKMPATMSPSMCGLFGETQIARSPIGPQIDMYQKMVCGARHS